MAGNNVYDGNLLPNTTGQDLGSSAKRYDAFLQNVDIAGTITGTAKSFNGYRVYSSANYASFQAAVDDTPAGGMLFVPAGTTITLSNTVNLTKSIWLCGGGRDSTTINANAANTLLPAGITAKNIRISGFTVDGGSLSGAGFIKFGNYDGVTYDFSQGRYTIEDCIIKNFAGTATAIDIGRSCYFVDIQRCQFRNNYRSIICRDQSEFLIADNEFFYQRTDSAFAHITVGYHSSAYIQNNDFENDNSVASIRDISISPDTTNGNAGYVWIVNNKFGAEGEVASRSKIEAIANGTGILINLKIQGNNFGCASGQTPIKLGIQPCECSVDNNFFALASYAVNDNYAVNSSNLQGQNTFRGNIWYTDFGTSAPDFVPFVNGGRLFSHIEYQAGSMEDAAKFSKARIEAPEIRNRLTYSYAINNWTQQLTSTTTGQTDPLGGTTACYIQRTAGAAGANIKLAINNSGMGTQFWVSFWAKAGTSSKIDLYINDQTQSKNHEQKQVHLSTAWERFSYCVSGLTAGNTFNIQFSPNAGSTNNADTVFLWGVQVSDYNSDYFPTNGTVFSSTSFGNRFSRIPLMPVGIQADVAVGANAAGTDLSIKGGQSTGTGTAGIVKMFINPTGGSGSTLNAHGAASHQFGYNYQYVVEPVNGAYWQIGHISELITLSTSGTTTDSVANLLPANSIIYSVTARVTTTIATATDWKLGDPTTAARFTAANATLVAGTTDVGLAHWAGAITTNATGPTQGAAAKVRITTTGTPSAGVVRVTVFFATPNAPTS